MVSKFSFRRRLAWNLKTFDTPLLVKAAVLIVIILIAIGIRIFLNQFTTESPYLIFITAVILGAWLFGSRAGIFITIITAFFVDYLFLPPKNTLRIENVGQLIIFFIYLFEGFLISWIISILKKSLQISELSRLRVVHDEKQFRLMIEGVKDYAIFFLNPDGFIVNWNEGAEQITEYPQLDAVGKHISIFFRSDEVKNRTPWKELEIAKTQGKFEGESWRLRADGSEFFAHVSVSPIFDEVGRLEGYVKIMHDITESKRLEQQKDNFISIASHELKTPITSIKAFIQLLQKHLKKSADTKSDLYLSRVDNQVNKLTQLIEELLDVSRITQGRLEYNEEVFPFDELVNETVEEIRPISDHKIIKKGRISTLVLADKYRVGQVITNLLTNAIKYSPGKDKIIVTSSADDKGVLLSVQDFGIGIPKDQQKRVFQRFYRVIDKSRQSYPGLGLGLFISSEIMKRHRGKMWFKSKEGKGSIFYFFLPITLREKFIQDLKEATPA